MKFRLIILLYFLARYNGDESIHENKFHVKQSIADESVVLGGIIDQFLTKYFSENKFFISIILGVSKKENNHFQDDFFNELFDNPVLTNLPHNILNKLDRSVQDHRNAFNLVLTEDSESLE